MTSFFYSDVNRSAHLVQQETNLEMYAVKLQSKTKPGYVRSLSYDPVDAWPRIRYRANLLLLCTQVKRLLASKSASELSWSDKLNFSVV